jgi:hypothetical protein
MFCPTSTKLLWLKFKVSRLRLLDRLLVKGSMCLYVKLQCLMHNYLSVFVFSRPCRSSSSCRSVTATYSITKSFMRFESSRFLLTSLKMFRSPESLILPFDLLLFADFFSTCRLWFPSNRIVVNVRQNNISTKSIS